MKRTLIPLMMVILLLSLGFRSRYSSIWKIVSGGIQYSRGNVNISNGTLTASGALTVASIDGEVITADTIDDDSIDFVDVTLADIPLDVATDVYVATKTFIKTINADSSDDDEDFEFDDSQGNVTEQTVDMGAIIPAYAEVLSAQLRCFETVAGSGSAVMAIDVGTSDGGAEIFATADIDTANDISATGAGDGPEIVATNAARNVWINATPDANWDTLTAGKWSVMVTYVDYGAVHTAKNP